MSTRRKRGLPVRRDTLLFLGGIAGIGYQQVTERYYIPLLVIYGLMAGIPGLAQLVLAVLRGLAAPEDGSDGDDSPSPMPSSPSPAPLSSSASQ